MSYVEELKKLDEKLGTVKRHVMWGPAAPEDEEERARIILSIMWKRQRGLYLGLSPDAKWWHWSSLVERVRHTWCVGRDYVYGVTNPYEIHSYYDASTGSVVAGRMPGA